MARRSGEVRPEDNSEDLRDEPGFFRRNLKYFVVVVALAFFLREKGIVKLDLAKQLHKAALSLEKQIPGLQAFGQLFHSTKTRGEKQEDSSDSAAPIEFESPVLQDYELKLMTDEDIKYREGGKLYLVILGHVFDVSGGATYYGKGGGYFGFIGKDGTKAFITGKFDKEGLTSDLSGLDTDGYIGIDTWIKFYKDHKIYQHVGFHVGRFFDENGKHTKAMKDYQVALIAAKIEAQKKDDAKKEFPLCNVEWKAATGTRFWCSNQSGGVNRDWSGYPHQFREPNVHVRCACVHPDLMEDPRVKPYENCDEDGENCFIAPETKKK